MPAAGRSTRTTGAIPTTGAIRTTGAGGSPPSEVDKDLRSLVERHFAHDERERAAKTRFLVELDRLSEPLNRDADPVHVTASAVVVGSRGTVLHRHRRLGRWLQPGGHVDAGESPQGAALREAAEETGLEVAHPDGGPSMIHVDVHPSADDHVHLDLRFLLVAPDRDPRPAPGESPDVRWFTWDEADAIADDALVGALRAAREVLGEAGHSDD